MVYGNRKGAKVLKVIFMLAAKLSNDRKFKHGVYGRRPTAKIT